MAGSWGKKRVPFHAQRRGLGPNALGRSGKPMAKIVPDDAVARWMMENGWWPYMPTGRFRKGYVAVVGRLECRAFLLRMTEQCFDDHRDYSFIF